MFVFMFFSFLSCLNPVGSLLEVEPNPRNQFSPTFSFNPGFSISRSGFGSISVAFSLVLNGFLKYPFPSVSWIDLTD